MPLEAMQRLWQKQVRLTPEPASAWRNGRDGTPAHPNADEQELVPTVRATSNPDRVKKCHLAPKKSVE
jgi:hypothetical protein